MSEIPDLTERLEHAASIHWCSTVRFVLREAAAEITALRAALAEADLCCHTALKVSDTNRALWQEEQARAAALQARVVELDAVADQLAYVIAHSTAEQRADAAERALRERDASIIAVLDTEVARVAGIRGATSQWAGAFTLAGVIKSALASPPVGAQE